MRILVPAIAMCLVLARSAATFAQPATEGISREVDILSPEFATIHGGIYRFEPIQEPPAHFLRVHFTDIIDASVVDYTVVVRDATSKEAFRYPKSAFSQSVGFWTGVIPGDTAQIEVKWSGGPPTGLRFVIRDDTFQAKMSHALSLTHNLLQPIADYRGDAGVWKASRAIAKLSYIKQGLPYSCTGFMISENLLLTNDHCVSDDQTCADTVAIFGFESNADGTRLADQQFACAKVMDHDFALDFALLRINGSPGDTTRWGHLEFSDRTLGSDGVYIVEHPGGELKQISKKECAVATPSAVGRSSTLTDFGHVCDTSDGSSGSPVLDATNRVVGLHHLGFARSGPWASQNRAVQATLISSRIAPMLQAP